MGLEGGEKNKTRQFYRDRGRKMSINNDGLDGWLADAFSLNSWHTPCASRSSLSFTGEKCYTIL